MGGWTYSSCNSSTISSAGVFPDVEVERVREGFGDGDSNVVTGTDSAIIDVVWPRGRLRLFGALRQRVEWYDRIEGEERDGVDGRRRRGAGRRRRRREVGRDILKISFD